MEKMASQTNALSRTTGSTWGFPMLQARQVYTAVIQPQMSTTPPQKSSAAGITRKLAKQQNKCLRLIAGAYKATPLSTVEAEVFIPPLDLHLDSVITRAIKRMEESGMARQIENACMTIRRKLCCQRQNHHVPLTAVAHPKPSPASWTKTWSASASPEIPADNPHNSEKRELLRRWRARWAVRKPPWGELGTAIPNCSVLKLHKGLSKA
jgi:hypothetical protein